MFAYAFLRRHMGAIMPHLMIVFAQSAQVKTGIRKGHTYSGIVIPLRLNWVNRQVFRGSPDLVSSTGILRC